MKTVADHHEQQRQYSCVQSAVELVLKLYGVIGEGGYPEQSIEMLDRKGFEPYTRLGQKYYHGVPIAFWEEKFDPGLQVDWDNMAWARGIALLRDGIYPIYSFLIASGDYHAFVGIPDDQLPLQFVTKTKLGPSEADIQSRWGIWQGQTKMEILGVKIQYPTSKNRGRSF